MSWFKQCKHDDEIVDKREFPSAYEQMATHQSTAASSLPAWAFERKTAYVFKCKVCHRTLIREITGPYRT